MYQENVKDRKYLNIKGRNTSVIVQIITIEYCLGVYFYFLSGIIYLLNIIRYYK